MAEGFGEILRGFRLAAGWTQEALAERSGVSTHAISTLESGHRRPRLTTVTTLADALGLGVEDRKTLTAAVGRDPVPTAQPGDEAPTAPRMLPHAISQFVGRESEVEWLLGLVDGARGSHNWAVTISAIDGMAGVGKTALAVHAAHRLADRFPDGQLFLDLHGYTRGMDPRDPADALASLLTSLGVPPGKIPAELDARAGAYRARLAGTRTLILLDNAATEAQVRPLIPGDPGCLVLITSRRRLKGLDEARTVALDVLPEPDAVALLRTLVQPARAPVQDDPGWAQIAELCGCLPLALRIAAALIRHRPAWTLEHLADKLRAAPLDLGPFTDGERDLSAMFDLSCQTLAAEQRQLLRRLGLAPGPDVDAYAAAALLDTDPARAEQLLQGLVDHHLLTEPATGRYRMHDLIRAYTHAQAMTLDPEPERDLALGRLLNYYAHTAHAASQAVTRFPRPEPGGPAPGHTPDLRDPDAARGWLRTEHPNLDAAFAHAHTHQLGSHTVALAAGLADTLYTDGPWARALDVHHAAAETAERLGRPAAHANALTDLGRVRYQLGDYPEASDAHTRAMEIHRAIGDRLGEAGALSDLGRVQYLTGNHSGAGDAFTRALEIYREHGHRLGEATALNGLGYVRYQAGDHPGAHDAFTRALEIYREIGHLDGEGIALTAFGRVRYLSGDYPGAVDALTQALEIHRGIGQRNGEATALSHLGRVRQLTGDHTGAVDDLTRALKIYRALGNRPDEASVLTGLGYVRHLTGDHPGAVDDLTQALAIYRETADRGSEAWALNHYAAAVAATGDRPRALTFYQQALAMNRELNKPEDEAMSLEGIADHHLAAGDIPRGTAHLRQALGIYQQLGMSTEMERVQNRLFSELDS